MSEFIINYVKYFGLGSGMILASSVVIFIIKKTKTKTDDIVLEKTLNILRFALKGIDIGTQKLPKGKVVDSIKLTKNAIISFDNMYKEFNGDVPRNTKKIAEILISELAKQREIDNIKK